MSEYYQRNRSYYKCIPNMPRCNCREIGTVVGAFLELWLKLSGLPLRASAGMARSCPAAEPILMMLWIGLMPAIKL